MPARASPSVRVTEAAFSPERELGAFMSGHEDSGACASFVGLVRGGEVSQLELQHYPGFTEAEIERIAAQIMERHAVHDLLVIHRAGRMAPGDAIVLTAALSPHRASAFRAVEEVMDWLKTDAPFWKREWRQDGAHWIEPTSDDRARRARHDTEKT